MDIESPTLLHSLPRGFRAVVIGASGGIGSAMCSLLRDRTDGGEITALSRRGDGLDILNEDSVARCAAEFSGRPIHFLFCATGALTIEGKAPEKGLKHIDPDTMVENFRINAVGPALIAKHFLPLMDRKQRAIAAFLSARVGSIGDNRLGGWISYRASKAALNQIVRTSAIEIARTHPQAVVAAVHPGTVTTELSAPYSAGHPTISADSAAARILATLDKIPPESTGSFWAYDGNRVEW